MLPCTCKKPFQLYSSLRDAGTCIRSLNRLELVVWHGECMSNVNSRPFMHNRAMECYVYHESEESRLIVNQVL